MVVSCALSWRLHARARAGKPPFNGANHVALLRAIERSEAAIPESLARALSASCVAMLHGLLRRNPVERMSFEEFFAHPFLRSGGGGGAPSSSDGASSRSSSLVSSAEPSPLKGPAPPAGCAVRALFSDPCLAIHAQTASRQLFCAVPECAVWVVQALMHASVWECAGTRLLLRRWGPCRRQRPGRR